MRRCLNSPLVGVLALKLLLVAAESLRLLNQHVFNRVVEQELFTKVAQLTAKELVELLHDGR